MNRRSPFQPFLTPDDLGIDLEEDSEDVTEEEIAGAVDTGNMPEFVSSVSEFIKSQKGTIPPRFELRRKGGILFCRASIGEQRRLFRAEWLRSSR